MEKNKNEYLTIGKEKYPTKTLELNHRDLLFYTENPRVYSVLNVNNRTPSQEEIEAIMIKKDHVKKLKESIKSNGGLIDPIIVRDGDFVVLEGNSRLAAYRILSRKDPIKWSKIKVTLLPKDIPEVAIFTLIGQYHIIGRKDWEPYEQAGYLYRMLEKSNKSPELLASELGMKTKDVKDLLQIYKYMIEKNDENPAKWSHYVELLRSNRIKRAFKEVPELEDKMVEEIKSGNIQRAIDIRKLAKIANVGDKSSTKVLRQISRGTEDIYSGFEIMSKSGKLDNNFQTLSKFRRKISEKNFSKKLLEEENIGNIKFELKKIERTISVILKTIERNEK